MTTPEERLAKIEEAISSIRNDATAMKRELSAHANKDEESIREIHASVDRYFSTLLSQLHQLEVNVLTSKADAREVAELRRAFWGLCGLLGGLGIIQAVTLLGIGG